jgi:hypothetical protein
MVERPRDAQQCGRRDDGEHVPIVSEQTAGVELGREFRAEGMSFGTIAVSGDVRIA